jgi:two-component system, chemotaxis family, protein-glutamate methylesterase/glutaminase
MSNVVPEDFRFDAQLVVIGASAGGIEALLFLFEGLPVHLAVPIVAMVHMPEDRDSRLAEIFAQRTDVPVREAASHAPLEPGVVYFAPSGYHLLVEADHSFSLDCEPPVNFSRPSIDVLMESCCDAFGDRVAGILLTGASQDGARGLQCIREHGGLAVVQDPDEAVSSTMPLAALTRAQPQYVLRLEAIRQLLHRLGAPR